MGLGINYLSQRTGRPVRVVASNDTIWKAIGVTTGWAGITAVTSVTTLLDDTVVQIGEKYLRYGTILVPLRGGVAYTAAITGTPTGGTFLLTVAKGTATATTGAIPYNATANQVKVALDALSTVNNSTVSLAGSTYTITFDNSDGVVTLTRDASGLTGGTTPNITVTNTVAAVPAGAGTYVPFDSSASDGRQTLERNNVGIVDVTLKDREVSVMGANIDNNHIGLVTGGTVWKERLKVKEYTGVATDPALADVLAAFPELKFAPTSL